MTKQRIIFSILLMIGIMGLPALIMIKQQFAINNYLIGLIGGTWFFFFLMKAYNYITRKEDAIKLNYW